MKVKDIIGIHTDFGFAKGGTKVDFIVKPKGTSRKYFHEAPYWLRNYPEVAEMEVKSWMICNARGNKCEFIIIVERDEKYEENKKKRFEELRENQKLTI